MNLRQAKKFVQANIIAGNSTILESDPGIGKTDLAGAIAKWFLQYHKNQNSEARIGMSVAFLATASPISATGLPWKSERTFINPMTSVPVTFTVTDPAIPSWYMAVDLETGEIRPASTFDHVFLVLEEWGQGSAEAKRAFAEVYYKGGTPPYYLPAGSACLALSNMDTRDGVTKEFDFIINRGPRAKVTGDANIWHDDFADQPYEWQGKTWEMLSVSKVWALRNPAILFEPKPKVQGPWCTPRSFTAQDRFTQSMKMLNNGVIPADDPEFIEGCAGYCGMAQTQSYVSTLKFLLELPSVETIAADPMGTPVPTKGDLQMLLAYELAGRVQRDQLGAVIQYISKRDAKGHGMAGDMHITFVLSLMRRSAKEFLNHPAMSAWLAKNANLVVAIGSLAK